MTDYSKDPTYNNPAYDMGALDKQDKIQKSLQKAAAANRQVSGMFGSPRPSAKQIDKEAEELNQLDMQRDTKLASQRVPHASDHVHDAGENIPDAAAQAKSGTSHHPTKHVSKVHKESIAKKAVRAASNGHNNAKERKERIKRAAARANAAMERDVRERKAKTGHGNDTGIDVAHRNFKRRESVGKDNVENSQPHKKSTKHVAKPQQKGGKIPVSSQLVAQAHAQEADVKNYNAQLKLSTKAVKGIDHMLGHLDDFKDPKALHGELKKLGIKALPKGADLKDSLTMERATFAQAEKESYYAGDQADDNAKRLYGLADDFKKIEAGKASPDDIKMTGHKLADYRNHQRKLKRNRQIEFGNFVQQSDDLNNLKSEINHDPGNVDPKLFDSVLKSAGSKLSHNDFAKGAKYDLSTDEGQKALMNSLSAADRQMNYHSHLAQQPVKTAIGRVGELAGVIEAARSVVKVPKIVHKDVLYGDVGDGKFHNPNKYKQESESVDSTGIPQADQKVTPDDRARAGQDHHDISTSNFSKGTKVNSENEREAQDPKNVEKQPGDDMHKEAGNAAKKVNDVVMGKKIAKLTAGLTAAATALKSAQKQSQQSNKNLDAANQKIAALQKEVTGLKKQLGVDTKDKDTKPQTFADKFAKYMDKYHQKDGKDTGAKLLAGTVHGMGMAWKVSKKLLKGAALVTSVGLMIGGMAAWKLTGSLGKSIQREMDRATMKGLDHSEQAAAMNKTPEMQA